MFFEDRADAGRQLVDKLLAYKKHKDAIVLGLARGGVVTAYEVARGLNLPLNVIVVRKIGAPANEELAIGATTETGDTLFNEDIIEMLGVSPDTIKKIIEREKKIAQERLARYRGTSPAPVLKGKIAIIVDDGIATGASMRVAIKSVRSQGVKKIVLAVPVAAPDSLRSIAKEVDEVVCLSAPPSFQAVGQFYREFDQTSDEEIIQLLGSSSFSL